METKTCTKCGIEKDISEFSITNMGKYFKQCKQCTPLYGKGNPDPKKEYKYWLYMNNIKCGIKYKCICHICKKEMPQTQWAEKNQNFDGKIISNINDYTLLVFCKSCWNQIRSQIHIIFLTDQYIQAHIITTIGIKSKTIKSNPTLIENYRIQLKFKRLLKTKKQENENNATS